MARVVLVQPPHRDTFGYSMPPLGLLHVGATARRRGHDARLLDLALLARRGELPGADPAAPDGEALVADCAARILALGPDAVGIGAMVSSMPAALHLAAALRARAPELPVILGGQGPEAVERAIVARYPAVDAVAVGEADATLADWLDVLATPRDWLSVPGLVVRTRAGHGRDGRGGTALGPADVAALVRDAPLRPAAPDRLAFPFRVDAPPWCAHATPHRAPLPDLDAVDPPAWDLAEPPRAYAAAAGAAAAMFPIDLGRGCTYACTFCTTPVFWGRTARQLSPARAVDELDRLAALDGVECAYVTHDLFTVDRQRVLAICAEKRRRGNTLPWECRTRIDLVDEELLGAMRAAGCRRILYGVESDSPAVLARVRKGGRAAETDVLEVLAAASRAGVASIVGLMAGVPEETAADVEASLSLMARAAVVDGASLSLHWHNVTPGNGRAAGLEGALHLVPGLTADLVRGFDLPAGHVPPSQRRLVADDAEVFGAFRVHAPAHTTPRALYLLSRNAHLVLEVLPRTARALAHATGATLLELLGAFLDEACAADDPDRFAEPLVLRRDAAARLFAEHARRHAREAHDALAAAAVAALAGYELALFDTETTALRRFAHDPAPLVAAMDAGRWPPDELPGPGAVLFARRGELTRATSLSPLLADVAEGLPRDELARRWPTAGAAVLDAAERLVTTRLADPAAMPGHSDRAARRAAAGASSTLTGTNGAPR